MQLKPDVYIAPLGAGIDREARPPGAGTSPSRRSRSNSGDETFRLKKSLETASKLGARFVLIVGENEVKPVPSR